jgi:hypothetical protein
MTTRLIEPTRVGYHPAGPSPLPSRTATAHSRPPGAVRQVGLILRSASARPSSSRSGDSKDSMSFGAQGDPSSFVAMKRRRTPSGEQGVHHLDPALQRNLSGARRARRRILRRADAEAEPLEDSIDVAIRLLNRLAVRVREDSHLFAVVAQVAAVLVAHELEELGAELPRR